MSPPKKRPLPNHTSSRLAKFARLVAVVKRKKKLAFIGSLFCIAGGIGFIAWANYVATQAGAGKLYSGAADVPERRVGLLLGCSKKLGTRDNLYYRYRIEAAEALWKAGKVRGFIVSGDNSSKYYSEPDDMKASLIELGVPEDKIVCDYAGLRTLDSVMRVREVFGQDEVLVISQQFHNERAIYIGSRNGVDMLGFNAQDVSGQASVGTKTREKLARVKMWLDINILATKAKYYGKRENVPF